ncbi:hypothetical protein [Stagnimonas aquatica]|uniref:hypothetical protein n=1 Tax=Stagnimonas aquatica TaxID=2689987 RepID=UPI0011CD87E6|nr:hypothetical protein [Stagnimonas aquatica]
MNAKHGDLRDEQVLTMATHEQLLSTGMWWDPPWWDDSALAVNAGSNIEEVRELIEVLKRYFDSDWTRKAAQDGRANAIIRFLWNGTGIWPLQDLLRLAHVMRRLDNAEGLGKKLSDLVGHKSHSTFFEFCIASRLAEPGCSVEFLPESNDARTPDLRVREGTYSFDVECKNLERDQWELWVQRLQADVIRPIGVGSGWNGIEVNVELSSRLSDLHFIDKKGDDGLSSAIRDEIAARIENQISEVDISKLPHEVSMPGVARIRVQERVADGVGGSVGGIEISPVAKLRKIIVNGVLPALGQLAASECGIVAVRSEHLPDALLFEIAMDALAKAKPDAMSRIAGVALFSPIQPEIFWTSKTKEAAADFMAYFGKNNARLSS